MSEPDPPVDPDVDVCVVGSANLDIVTRVVRLPHPGETLLGTDYHEYPGGKGLNQAVSSARSGARTCFIGALGTDEAAMTLRQILRDEQIDAGRVVVTTAPTGRAVIFVADDGENVIVVVPGANGEVVAPSALPACRVVLAQLEVPVTTVTEVFELAGRAGSTTVLNPAPAAELPPELIARCDIMVPNEHELGLLGGVDRLRAVGCDTIIVTLGGEGVDVYHRDDHWRQPPFDVDVVDTTGAGDAFCGALAARLAAGSGLPDAVRWAAAAGALATTLPGAVPAQPNAKAVSDLINRRG